MTKMKGVLICLLLFGVALKVCRAQPGQSCDPALCPSGVPCLSRPRPQNAPLSVPDVICDCSTIRLIGPLCDVNTQGLTGPDAFITCYGNGCRTGVFESQNYPNPYPNGWRSTYQLYIPGARAIDFQFVGDAGFSVESQKDSLWVGTGLTYDFNLLTSSQNISDATTIGGIEVRFFDNLTAIIPEAPSPPSYPGLFRIESDTAWLRFETDRTITQVGWRIQWTSMVDDEPPFIGNCPTVDVRGTVVAGAATSAVVTWVEPTANDLSPPVSSQSTHRPGQRFPVGTTTVVYTFRDRFGSSATCEFRVIVTAVDPDPPIVSDCPSNIVRVVELGIPFLSVSWTVPTASDSSGSPVTVTNSHDPGDNFPAGQTTVVTYIFTDGAGNSASCVFNVQVNEVDRIPPDIQNCPNNIVETIELGTGPTSVSWVVPTATDASGTQRLQSNTHNPGDEFNVGSVAVTYVFVDQSGNDATCRFIVTVRAVDTTPPVINNNCPDAIPVFIEVGQPGRSVSWALPTASDASGPVNIDASHNPGAFFLAGQATTVTYTFTDETGNSALCSFCVNLLQQDTIPPVISNCPTERTVTIELGLTSGSTSWTIPTATDNSGMVELVSNSADPGDDFPIGETTVLYVFADPTGNVATCEFVVTVITVDRTPPDIVGCPVDIVEMVELGSGPTRVFWTAPTSTDVSNTQRLISNTHDPGDEFPIGTVSVAYVFGDSSNNEATCSFRVTVTPVDTTPPEVSGCPIVPPEIIEVDRPGISVTWIEPTSFDASNSVEVTASHNSGQFFLGGRSTTVTYLFTDVSGNSALCSFCVNVIQVDTIPPVISGCPADRTVTIELGLLTGVSFWTPPTATDNSGTATLQPPNRSPGDDFPIGSTTVVYVFIDPSDNPSTCQFIVTVVPDDTVAPTIENCPTIPVEVTVELGTTGAVLTWTEPTASDISGTAMLTQRSHVPGSFFQVGPTMVTYTFTDSSNNVAICTFLARVNTVDTTPPDITGCPPFVLANVELGNDAGRVSWVEPTATDPSEPVTRVSRSHMPNQLFTVGTTTVTYVFMDRFQNRAECEFQVIVEEVDTVPPVISGCNDVVGLAECNLSGTTVTWVEPTATDLSGQAELETRSHAPGTFFNEGSTMVTYVFRDPSGNRVTCSFTVTVELVDTTPPDVVGGPVGDSVTEIAELGTDLWPATWPVPTAEDLCGPARLITSSHNPGDRFPTGRCTTVTYEFSDLAGNTVTYSFSVTFAFEDTTPPTISGCPTEAVVAVIELGTFQGTVPWIPPTATDLSPPVSVDASRDPGSFFPVGDTIVIYRFFDSVGNEAMCQFPVTVNTVDRTDPTISDCPGTPVSATVELGITSAVVTYVEPTATDASNAPNLLQTRTCDSGGSYPVGETVCVYLFRDPSNNSATCRFTIVVTAVDRTPPTISNCPRDNIEVIVELGVTQGVATWVEPTATDLSGASLQSRERGQPGVVFSGPGELFPLGLTSVYYFFVDSVGNVASCHFDVFVFTVDTVPPTISGCPTTIRELIELGTPGIVIELTPPTATDLSGTVNLMTSDIPAFFTPGVIVITYTFTDSSGNSAVCSIRVEVIEVDTAPPFVSNCPNDVIEDIELGTPSGPVSWIEPTVSDQSGTATLITRSHRPGQDFSVGSVTVTYLFRDNTGNTATCTFCVTVVEVDRIPPMCVNLPPALARTIELGTGGTEVVFTDPTCTDASGTGTIVSRSHSSGDFFTVGETPVSFVCSDASGNTAPCTPVTVRITPVDTIAPTVDFCPPDQTIDIELGQLRGPAFWVEPIATDLSGTVDVTRTHQPGDDFPIGKTTVVYTFTDSSGNVAMCSFVICVRTVDTIPPDIGNCPEMIERTVELSRPQENLQVQWVEPTATDRSGVPMLVRRTHAPGSSFPAGVSQVVYTFRDTSDNEAVCTFMVVISVIDTTPPDCVNTPTNILVTTELGNQGRTVDWTEPTCFDISGVASVSQMTHGPGSFFLVESTTVTYTCTDGSGNSGRCSFNVRVDAVDTIPPVVTCPDDIAVSAIAGAGSTYVDYVGQVAKTDNSGSPSIVSIQPESGTSFASGTTPVVITVTDPSGNIASCTFDVTVFPVDPCEPEPCLNGGFCVVDSLTEFRCICPDCFIGDRCQFPISACDSSNCQNGAACVEVPGSCTIFTCECPECFTGDVCQNFQDVCLNNECQNGAQCNPTEGCVAYTCQCPTCFQGAFCERRFSICDVAPCANGAQCIPSSSNPLDCFSFSCRCTGCFAGVRCDIAINPCFPNPCQSGGVCSRDPGSCQGYTCDCNGCFDGINCERAIPNPCFPNPCVNGGLCSQIPGSCTGFQCTCSGPFGGFTCDNAIAINRSPCNSFPCEAGSTCIPTSSAGYVCVCRNSFTGINCGTRTVNLPGSACLPNPCLNSGTCRNSFDSSSNQFFYETQYVCLCAEGFTGTNCQFPSVTLPITQDRCRLQPCRNNEDCVNVYNSFPQAQTYSCQCGVGLVGQDCEIQVQNPCDSNPCQNGAPCIPFNTYFRCACTDGSSGDFCQIPPNSAVPLITRCPIDDIVIRTAGNSAPATWIEPISVGVDQAELVYQSHQSGATFPLGQTAVTYVYSNVNEQFQECQFFVVVLETNRCLGLPCWNGGRCIETGPITCDCSGTGFTGPTCDDVIGGASPCAPNPCLNRGTCIVNTDGSFTCLCAGGFEGRTCADVTQTDPCNPSPCLNGGTCFVVPQLPAGFFCSCTAGLAGQICESPLGGRKKRDASLELSFGRQDTECLCENGGVCPPGLTDVCTCPEAYEGTFCQDLKELNTADGGDGATMTTFPMARLVVGLMALIVVLLAAISCIALWGFRRSSRRQDQGKLIVG